MNSAADQQLMEYVQEMINTGKTQITLPGHLLENASEEALDEVRRLCKLNGVELEVQG